MDVINKKNNIKLIFEQDGASSHKSKSNIHLLNKLFGESGWIQNPPNSPDLASPIEDLWAIIKPRVKRRNPQTVDQLKEFLLEEWNSIPINLVQNLCKGYTDRLKKVIDLKGRRLEPEHLYKNSKDIYIWRTPEILPSFRYVYNDKIVKKYKERDIKDLNAQIKEVEASFKNKIKSSRRTKNRYKRRDLKNLLIGHALSIIEGPERLNNEKNKMSYKLTKKLKELKNMSLEKYIELKENEIKEQFKVNKDNIIDEDEILIENKIKNI